MTGPDDRWTSQLRALLLKERQVLAALERHRESASEAVKVRYAFPVSLGERRLRLLEAALRDRGVGPAIPGTGFVRATGRLIGALTGWGGRRRTVASDLEGLTRLGDSYFAAYRDGPPHDIEQMIAGFLGEIETERCALLDEFRTRGEDAG